MYRSYGGTSLDCKGNITFRFFQLCDRRRNEKDEAGTRSEDPAVLYEKGMRLALLCYRRSLENLPNFITQEAHARQG